MAATTAAERRMKSFLFIGGFLPAQCPWGVAPFQPLFAKVKPDFGPMFRISDFRFTPPPLLSQRSF
jgi:hypothetical protein